MQTILNIDDCHKTNKRRKIDCNIVNNNFGHSGINETNEINKINVLINTNNNFINELDKCKNIDQIGEFILNDYRLFYTKEQTIFIINKFLQLQKHGNYETCYYS